jgi:hypothetical protein
MQLMSNVRSQVNALIQRLQRAIKDYGMQSESDCSFLVDFFVFTYVDDENVQETLKFLSTYPMLNRIFWRMINEAPTSEEAWGRVFCVSSGGEDLRERQKAIYRSAVETVRRAIGPEQERRSQLFRK